MERAIYQVVTRDSEGQIVTREFESLDEIGLLYRQRGTDNCSTHKTLRKLPLFSGLIGPMKEGQYIRYESPEAFEYLTQEWYAAAPVSRSRKMSL